LVFILYKVDRMPRAAEQRMPAPAMDVERRPQISPIRRRPQEANAVGLKAA